MTRHHLHNRPTRGINSVAGAAFTRGCMACDNTDTCSEIADLVEHAIAEPTILTIADAAVNEIRMSQWYLLQQLHLKGFGYPDHKDGRFCSLCEDEGTLHFFHREACRLNEQLIARASHLARKRRIHRQLAH
jgi:hypothetical protein